MQVRTPKTGMAKKKSFMSIIAVLLVRCLYRGAHGLRTRKVYVVNVSARLPVRLINFNVLKREASRLVQIVSIHDHLLPSFHV